MRTTLDIDEDVLLAIKDLARRERRAAGKVLSDLARIALNRPSSAGVAETSARYGFAPKPSAGVTVSNAQIDALREALGED